MKKRFKKFYHSKRLDKKIRREQRKISSKVKVERAYNLLIECITEDFLDKINSINQNIELLKGSDKNRPNKPAVFLFEPCNS